MNDSKLPIGKKAVRGVVVASTLLVGYDASVHQGNLFLCDVGRLGNVDFPVANCRHPLPSEQNLVDPPSVTSISPSKVPSIDTEAVREAERAIALEGKRLGILSLRHDLERAKDALKEIAGTDDEYDRLILTTMGEGNIEAGLDLLAAAANDSTTKQKDRWAQVGGIAYLVDTELALSAYKRLTEMDADNASYWNLLGQLHYRSSSYLQSEEAYLRAVELSDDDGIEALALANLGSVYSERGNLDLAVAKFTQALTLNTKLGYKRGMANNYANIGIVHTKRDDLDDALAAYQKALVLNIEEGLKQGMANNYTNIGIVYAKRGEFDEAMKNFDQSLTLNTELGDKEGMANDYANLGLAYKDLRKLKQARRAWELSVSYFEEIGSPSANLVRQSLQKLPVDHRRK